MTLEERIQMSIGGFVFQICDLQAKLNELQARVAELEGKPLELPKEIRTNSKERNAAGGAH